MSASFREKILPSWGVGEGLPGTTLRSASVVALGETISGLTDLDANGLCLQWRNHLGGSPLAHLPPWLLLRILAYRIQAIALGGLNKETLRALRQPNGQRLEASDARPFQTLRPTTRDGASLRAGALLVREWNGKLQRVMVLEEGFAWNGETGNDREKGTPFFESIALASPAATSSPQVCPDPT